MINSSYSISILPPEIVSQLFSLLGPRDLASCAQVSTIWRQLAQDRRAHGDPHFYKHYMAWVQVVVKGEKLRAESEGRVYREIGDRTSCSASEWVQVSARFLLGKIRRSDDHSKQLDEEIRKLEVERERYLFIRGLFGDYSRFENLPVTKYMKDAIFYLGPMVVSRQIELTAPVMRGEHGFRQPLLALKVCFESRSEESGAGYTAPMIYMNLGKAWLIGGYFRGDAPFVGERNCYDTIRTLLTVGKIEVDEDYKGEGHRLLGTYRLVS